MTTAIEKDAGELREWIAGQLAAADEAEFGANAADIAFGIDRLAGMLGGPSAMAGVLRDLADDVELDRRDGLSNPSSLSRPRPDAVGSASIFRGTGLIADAPEDVEYRRRHRVDLVEEDLVEGNHGMSHEADHRAEGVGSPSTTGRRRGSSYHPAGRTTSPRPSPTRP